MANKKLCQLSHCTFICKYQLVWASKYRGKVLVNKYIKQEMKRTLKKIARWKGLIIHAWHIGDEHIHLHITIPPKYSVSYAIQILKGKSSSWIKKKTNKFSRGGLWVRGYFASTVGLNEHAVQMYVKNQKHYQIELEQQKFKFNARCPVRD